MGSSPLLGEALSQTGLPHSRCHPFPILNRKGTAFYLKRDDELGPYYCGGKHRKYHTLLPHIEKEGYAHVFSWGSPFSNHLLTFGKLLQEKEIPFTFFVLERHGKLEGNAKLLFELCQNALIEVKRPDWEGVASLVTQAATRYAHPFICPEGAFCKEALTGAMSLAQDIKINEKEHDVLFSDIFIDAGTGLSAIGLLKGLGKTSKRVHILLLAEEEGVFLKKLEGIAPLPEFHLYRPSKLKSFGAVSKAHLKRIEEVRQKSGVVLDPLYNAKLFSFIQEARENVPLGQNALMIHSGGTHTLPFFLDLR